MIQNVLSLTCDDADVNAQCLNAELGSDTSPEPTFTFVDDVVTDNIHEGDVIYRDHTGVSVTTGPTSDGHEYSIVYARNNYIFSYGMHFQNGPVGKVGVNGYQNEHLLAILIHRTEILNSQFQSGLNEEALTHMRIALRCFNERTELRILNHTEGTDLP